LRFPGCGVHRSENDRCGNSCTVVLARVNRRTSKGMRVACEQRDMNVVNFPISACTDNGAKIGYAVPSH
jgi:hypothetical protein